MKVIFWLKRADLYMQRLGDRERHKVSYQDEDLLFRTLPEAVHKDIMNGWTLCLIIDKELYGKLRNT